MKSKQTSNRITLAVLLIAICIVSAADAQVLFTSRRAWVMGTDCSAITTNGHGCYDSDNHTYCLGNGTACAPTLPPVGANFTTQATLGTELVNWSAAGWNEDGSTWTFSGGVLTHVTGNTTAVTSSLVSAPVAGTTYKVTITGTGGGATATYTLGGVTGTTIAASGAIAITDYITASTTGQLIITPSNTCTVAITNISVKALTDGTGDFTAEGNIYARSPVVLAYGGSASYPTIGWPDISGMFNSVGGSINFVSAGAAAGRINASSLDIYGFIRLGSSSDVVLIRDAANILAMRNSTAQQTLKVANTYTDSSNYERLSITGLAGNSGNMTMETAGTGGDNLHLVLSGAGTGSVKLRGPSWSRTTTKTVSTTPVTLTAEEICNADILVTTGASVINLPAKAATLDGCRSRFKSKVAVAYSIDPNGTDVIVLNGTPLTGGNKITSDGAIDASVTLVYDGTDQKFVTDGVSGVFSDGGA